MSVRSRRLKIILSGFIEFIDFTGLNYTVFALNIIYIYTYTFYIYTYE